MRIAFRFIKPFFFLLLIGFTCISILQNKVVAQGLPSGGEGNRIEGNFKFMPIPYINYDRSIGFSIGALPMAMFNPVKKDTISPSSVAGLFGMYTTNDTWFLMGFGAFFLDEDNWRITAAGGLGSINFQFYLDNPVGAWIPYNTQADFVYLGVSRRVYDKLYFGLSYIYANVGVTTELVPDTLATTLNGLGFDLSFDKRSNVYYPRSGYYANIDFNTFPAALENEFESNKIQIDYNHYFSARNNRDVIAGRLFAGIGLGDLFFAQQFIIGQDDIRGYTQGAYRGNYLLALQGEYRYNFENRMGLVGFLGFATVFESINEDDNGKILPGIGTGFRYTVSKDTHMNAGMDIAAGIGDWGIYFRISEAF